MKKTTLLFIAIVAITFTSHSQNTWTQKADFGGGGRCWCAAFSIGNKGYAGLGFYYTDFWEYDPVSDIWIQKASFPAAGRAGLFSFSIWDKGYLGTGASFDTTYHTYDDFWEYDPVLNVWNQKADFPGGLRVDAFGFSSGTKGYVGSGGDGYGYFFNDFWEYDPVMNEWTQKSDFGGVGRANPATFSIGNKGYVTAGGNGGGDLNDTWEYDMISDAWTQKADFTGIARSGSAGLSIENKGYLCTGQGYNGNSLFFKDCWQYNPANDAWTQQADIGGPGRTGAFAFSIGNKGYLGTGISMDSAGTYQWGDFWEFAPLAEGISSNNAVEKSISVFPNPAKEIFTLNLSVNNILKSEVKIEVINSLGQVFHSQNAMMLNGKLQQEIRLTDVAAGMYLVKATIDNCVYTAQINLQK